MSFRICSSSILVALAVISLAATPSNSHFVKCSGKFLDIATTQIKNMSHCKKLTTLSAQFSWRLDSGNRSRFKILLGVHKHAADLVWLAWGLNPKEPQMVGTRAIIGIRQPDGTRNVNTYNVTMETMIKCPLVPSPVEVEFHNITFEYVRDADFTLLSANVGLPSDYDPSKLHMVWQIGQHADGNQPLMHSTTLENVDSGETVNLDNAVSHHVGLTRHYLRVTHGVFNIVGWGILFPCGVIVVRYFNYPLKWIENRVSVHKVFQLMGFAFGATGWGLGLWLGHASKHYTFRTHRHFAIFIFSFTALQMLALRFKPAPDGPLRRYWNIYHHLVGYSLLVVIGINIFKGIDILKPHNAAYRWSYVAILVVFALIFLCLETYTWVKFKFFNEETPKKDGRNNGGGNGGNGGGDKNKQQQQQTGSDASSRKASSSIGAVTETKHN